MIKADTSKIMRKLLIITIFFLPQILLANVTRPVSLHELVEKSEFIIYGQVLDVEENKEYQTIAVLSVQNILKGGIQQDTIRILFSKMLVCPSPAEYNIGDTVLTFLNRADMYYRPYGLVYGSKDLSYSEFEIYKQKIDSLSRIINLSEEKERNKKLIDWYIDCVGSNITSWEGAYELRMKYDRKKKKNIYPHKLSDSQTSRLRSILLKKEEIEYWEIDLINLIKKDDDSELIEYLIDQLRKSNIKNMVISEHLMPLIANLSNRDDLKDLNNEYWNFTGNSPENWDEVIVKKYLDLLNTSPYKK